MKISSLLREAPGTPTLSLDQDLMQRAMLKFPGYDKQQALSLYIADKASQQEKIDASQNNLINTQRSAIQTLQGELDANEDEVERIKQLTARVTAGSADTRQKAKVSGDELEKLQKQLEELKDKPNLDPKQYKEMEAQIMALASNPSAENTDVKKLQSLVNQIDSKATVNYDAVYKKLQATQKELDDKEERFADYVDNTNKYKKTSKKDIEDLTKTSELMAKNSAEEIKKYADIVNTYKKNIDDFDNEIKATTAQTKNDAEEARKVLNIIKSLYNNAKDSVDPTAPALDTTTQAANDQSEPEQTNQQGQQLAPLGSDLLNQYKGKNINIRAESVQVNEYEKSQPRIYKDWGDPKFNNWMKDHLTILINLFKGHFKDELARKNPTYGDGQISYDIQEEAWYLKKIFDGDEPILTKKKMDAYLDLVKMTLFSQPVEISHQDDLPLRESLHKTYERMLDNLIGLPYIKG